MPISRRDWCLSVAAAPAIAAALADARNMAMGADAQLQFLDTAAAGEINALVCQIIPSTDGPGAREAGVIYFIDRALATFASDDRESYRMGMSEAQQRRKELFPGSSSIASLNAEQQTTLLSAIETSEFFQLLRTHTVLGFLGDPRYGGNRDEIGWKQIRFQVQMSYQHPFGFYDGPSSGASSK